MRVKNLTDSAIGIQGVSIPAGQERNVRGFDPDKESNRVRIEAGDIDVAGQSKPMYVQTEPELPEDAKAEDYLEDNAEDNEQDSVRKRLFGS